MTPDEMEREWCIPKNMLDTLGAFGKAVMDKHITITVESEKGLQVWRSMDGMVRAWGTLPSPTAKEASNTVPAPEDRDPHRG